MFGNFSFFFLTLLFTLIPTCIFWVVDFRFLKNNVKVILAATLISVVGQILSDPFGELWGTWIYNGEKILGIWIFNWPIENFIFAALVSFGIASAILTYVHRIKQ